jgi:short-subunit dehydrogenase
MDRATSSLTTDHNPTIMSTKQQGYALITGGSQGIGAAIALELAGRGFGVIVTARNADQLKDVCAKAGALNGGRALSLPIDLLSEGGVDRVVGFVREKNLPLTCLVNNAGHAHWGLFGDEPMEQHRKLMRLNMDVPVALTYALLPDLKKAGRAYILNTSSMTAFHALASMALYAASKAFILRWSRALRLELKRTGISVTAVCPGAVITSFTERAGMQAMDDLAQKFGSPPEPVAKSAVAAMLAGKAEVVPGILNKLTRGFQRLMPMSVNAGTASGIYLKRLPRRNAAR